MPDNNSDNSCGKLQLIPVSSLEKIFPDEPCACGSTYEQASMFLNERFSYQLAYYYDGPLLPNVKVTVESPLKPWITIRKTGLVPSEYPCPPLTDDNVLRRVPGLYPDPLYDIPYDFELLPGQWRSLFISVGSGCSLPAGTYPVSVFIHTETGSLLGSSTFTITRLDMHLPPQSLCHTEWFHADCIADWYNTEILSDEHFLLMERYIKTAVTYGCNMILTPLFTPPLDTAVGTERPTVQLVEVRLNDGMYSFNMDLLDKWISMCERAGITYFEFSHLFTQWGAKYAPKIILTSEAGRQQLFGWNTPGDSEEYRSFLSQFLPVLSDFVEKRGLKGRCFIHVSDEPQTEQGHLPSYQKAKAIVDAFRGCLPVMDALSSYSLYKQCKVDYPVCATDSIRPFLENHAENLWCYYCSAQFRDVSNRFFCMPTARIRILGMQMYKYNIYGFLHWGYNFWYCELSRYPVNPYMVTDASRRYPSGDAFLVYPGENGPVPSLRLEAMGEAIQDMRALYLLESLTSREAALEFLEEGLEAPLTFSSYPADSKWLLDKRAALNRRILEASQRNS